MTIRYSICLLVLSVAFATVLAAPVQWPPVDSAEIQAPLSLRSERSDTLFYFAAEGAGSYGTLGTTERGFSFDGSGECATAGWIANGTFATLRTNTFLPGDENDTCVWTFFDPDTTEPGYPMGVYPYGPPYMDMSIQSPTLSVDQNGVPLSLEEGSDTILLAFDLYKDFPINALIFYYSQLAIHTSSGGSDVEEISTVFYGEGGWEHSLEDITDRVWLLQHEPGDEIVGIEVHIWLVDFCPYWCDLYGSGYPHTLAGLVDNVSLMVVPEATGLPGDTAPAAATELSAHPNPFNPSTRLSFELSAAGETTLSLHDLSGRTLRRLVHASLDAGHHEYAWDGTDDAGTALASGIYLATLEQQGQAIASTKLTLLK